MSRDASETPSEEPGAAATGEHETRTVAPVGSPAVDSTLLLRGAAVGRYVVLRALGSGGMGNVYAAYDPELRREVALKVLRGGLRTSGDASRRLLREARAIARLTHPNVVTVYDAGTDRGVLFIAMELVAGRTVSHWLRKPRSRPDILRVFRAAGRGLAAAHAAGLVHRDFKPGNVMLGDDGRVRVLDFGLVSDRPRDTTEGDTARSPKETGVVGTPAYMAPEQRDGARADARADQFSFCTSLYEALLGEPPTVAPVARQPEIAGSPQESRAPGALPAWLRRVLARGLAEDPASRFASMDDLLEALGRDPVKRRRRWLGIAAAVVAAVGAAGLVPRDGAEPLCRGAEQQLVGVWDEAVRSEARPRLSAHGSSELWERARGLLDRYAEEWSGRYREACEATRVRKERSETMLDRQMVCLDSRLRDLRATTELLAGADAQIAGRALAVIDGLGDLRECSNLEALTLAEIPPPPAELASEVEATRQVLASVRARQRAGRFGQALELARGAREEAERLAYPPLLPEALVVQAEAEGWLGRQAEMKAGLLRALGLATELGHERQVAEALSFLVVSGHARGESEEAEMWGELAGSAIRRLGGIEALEARRQFFLGLAALGGGRPELAVERLEAALEIDREPTSLKRFSVLTNLAGAHEQLGRLALAETTHRQAVQLLEEVHGPEHPSLMAPLCSLGDLELGRGRPRIAIPHYERALALVRGTDASELVHTGPCQLGLGRALLEVGRTAEAAEVLERGVALAEQTPGDPLVLAGMRYRLALALARIGEEEERIEELARAALGGLQKVGGRGAAQLGELERWLVERRESTS